MHTYKEITNDNGARFIAFARDNNARYIITSARAKDLLADYMGKYDRYPTARWLNKNIGFDRIK